MNKETRNILSPFEEKILIDSIQSQIEELRKELQQRENFITKDDWKKLSFVEEKAGDELDEPIQSE
jgi:hypothetical protein